VFVLCKVDYYLLVVFVLYYYLNVDSDEVMFYVDGDYEVCKGSGIGKGLVLLYLGGYSYGL